jgi:catechol 2,3-dioxygenase-like lactoylglutathione lyase family enzyme
MRIREIDHVVLRVRDLDTVRDFYCTVLGCTELRRTPREVGLLQLRAGRSIIDLVSVDGAIGRQGGEAPGATARNMDHFCLLVEDFDALRLREELAARGVKADVYPGRGGPGGADASLYVRDPEGNTVELRGADVPRRGEQPGAD